jgi:hypothetical protein
MPGLGAGSGVRRRWGTGVSHCHESLKASPAKQFVMDAIANRISQIKF